jgi:hypothetical protein
MSHQRTGIHRTQGAPGLPNDVRVSVQERNFDVTEAEYRSSESSPPFETLAWRDAETEITGTEGQSRLRYHREAVTFYYPFTLDGLNETHPAGTYMVVTQEEEVSGVSPVSWRRIATEIHLPAIGVQGAQAQAVKINPEDLAEIQIRDAYRDQP